MEEMSWLAHSSAFWLESLGRDEGPNGELAFLGTHQDTALAPTLFDDSVLNHWEPLTLARRKPKQSSGSNGDDINTVKGNTTYKALRGDDQITVRKSDNIVLGGGGNDWINAKKGRGDNVLKGGGGKDELIGGGQNDLLIGGGGADLLVIADGKLNKGMSIIKGFQGRDAIAIRNVKKADEFDDLTFKKQGKDTLIRVGTRDIALVRKTKPNALKKRADDFIFSDESSPDIPVVVPGTLPVISMGDRTTIEGNSGVSNTVFTVSLNQASPDPITVNYTTANGTATAGSDYTAVSGTLTFAPNATTQTITVPILGDEGEEADETFSLNLSSPIGATVSTPSAIATILNDDIAPEFRDKRQGKKLAKPSAQPDLDFLIFDKLKTGQVIVDSNDSPNIGVFEDAIEGLDFSTVGFLNGINASLDFAVGTLTANHTGNTITYLFSSDQVEVSVNNPGAAITLTNETLAVEALALTVDLTSPSLPDDFDPGQAVNDLDYIIEQSVFHFAIDASAYGGIEVTDISFFPNLCPDDDFSDANCEDLEENVT